LAWIVHGLGQRNDITVVSVERDHERAAVVQDAGWPRWVSIMVGDEAELLETLGSFDLIFADTPSSKLDNLPATIAALHPGGLLLVDDMDPPSPENPQGLARIAAVRHQLLRDPHLFCAELSLSVGVILAARQRL
jgi:predicted O-methyltransferase YrrM